MTDGPRWMDVGGWMSVDERRWTKKVRRTESNGSKTDIGHQSNGRSLVGRTVINRTNVKCNVANHPRVLQQWRAKANFIYL
jgi:hypothetical protein